MLKNLSSLEGIILPYFLKNKKTKQKKYKQEISYKIFNQTLLRLRQFIKKLKPKIKNTNWGDYEENRNHYSKQDIILKKNFIKDSIKNIKGPVLDLGCNQGEYSIYAEEEGIEVVATDFDEDCLNKLTIKSKGKKITVCNLDVANPTPAIGWDNNEHQAFLNKSENKFNLVFCLGLIHHLLITERIPLNKIIEQIKKFTKKYVIIEFVKKEDEKFIQLARHNIELYKNIDKAFFEKELVNSFTIIKKKELVDTNRILYFIEKK